MIRLLATTWLLTLFCCFLAYKQGDQTTQTPQLECPQRNRSCEQCVTDNDCFWCKSSKSCHSRSQVKACSWGDARWHYCWLNVKALVISCAVIGGLLLLVVIIVCCWCCRKYDRCIRRRTQRQIDQQELETSQRNQARRAENERRRNERQARSDEIRVKYGLPGGGPRHERLTEDDDNEEQ